MAIMHYREDKEKREEREKKERRDLRRDEKMFLWNEKRDTTFVRSVCFCEREWRGGKWKVAKMYALHTVHEDNFVFKKDFIKYLSDQFGSCVHVHAYTRVFNYFLRFRIFLREQTLA